jgi:hypothetical protein
VPGGSYLRTCSDVQLTPDGLRAACRTMNGGWRRTFLRHASDCAVGIENIDGPLQCSAWRQPASRLPGGSYLETCSHARMRGDMLTANCRTRRGDWVQSALPQAYVCRGIDNIDGNLMCRR